MHQILENKDNPLISGFQQMLMNNGENTVALVENLADGANHHTQLEYYAISWDFNCMKHSHVDTLYFMAPGYSYDRLRGLGAPAA